MVKKGTLLVVSGPAGVGKGTVVAKAVEESNGEIYLSVSATTRKPRSIDVEGVTYFFKTKEEFESMIANDMLLEYACYVGNYYGTPLKPVLDAINKGKDVILEIEVQGALRVKEKFPEAVLMFIVPPDINELESRLRGRGTETEEQINMRLNRAKEEFELISNYEYIVVNNTVEQAVCDLMTVLNAQRLKKEKYDSNLLMKG